MNAPPLSTTFGGTARNKANASEPKLTPYSIRFTVEERAQLNRDACGEAWSNYIRRKLFGDAATPRVQRIRKPKRPTVDQTAIAKVLAGLGHSRLSQNMNQIAKAANMGALPVSNELEEELKAACAEIALMRVTLISALGLKPEGDES